MTTDHFPDASKMIPTPDDYAIDPAADLAIQQAATPGPWEADTSSPTDCVIFGPDDGEGGTDEGFIANIGRTRLQSMALAFDCDERNAVAIANAGTHAPAWLRRLIAAEAAIIAWAEAVGAPVPHDAEAERRIEERESRLLILATRIRAGREKGAGA